MNEKKKEIRIHAMDKEALASINEALKREKDPYIKAAIIIFKSMGMRMGEMLELTTDCIKQIKNIYTITWTDTKIQTNLRNDEKIHTMCLMPSVL